MREGRIQELERPTYSLLTRKKLTEVAEVSSVKRQKWLHRSLIAARFRPTSVDKEQSNYVNYFHLSVKILESLVNQSPYAPIGVAKDNAAACQAFAPDM